MSNESHDSIAKPTIIDLDPDQVVEDTVHSPADAAKKSRTKTPNRFLIWSVAALATAAISGGWFYRDVLSTYFPSDQFKAAEERSVQLEADNKALHEELARLDKLTASLGGSFNELESKATTSAAKADAAAGVVQDSEARVAALVAGLNETKKTIADLSGKFGTSVPSPSGSVDGAAFAALSARIEALEKDVASLKTSRGSGATDTALLSQSLSDLKAKISSGVGYADELARIQRFAPAAPGLDVLALSAVQGIPDAKGLGEELSKLATSLPKPAPLVEEDGGSLLSNAWKAVSGLVRVRNLGEVDWPAAAKSAATFAGQGELQQAIDQLNAIEGTKPAELAQWMERAEARLKLETATQAVGEAVMRIIAAKG